MARTDADESTMAQLVEVHGWKRSTLQKRIKAAGIVPRAVVEKGVAVNFYQDAAVEKALAAFPKLTRGRKLGSKNKAKKKK